MSSYKIQCIPYPCIRVNSYKKVYEIECILHQHAILFFGHNLHVQLRYPIPPPPPRDPGKIVGRAQVAKQNPGRSGGRIFFSRVHFVW